VDGVTPIQGDHTADPVPPSENDYSIAIKVRFGTIDYATAGDSDGEYATSQWGYTYNDVESILAPRFGQVDVLRANHHGSGHSSSQSYVDTLDPDASAISCGNNTYGHPGQAVLDRLLATGDVYLTNLCDTTRNYGAAVIVNGDILLQSNDGVNYTVNGVAYVASDPVLATNTPLTTATNTSSPTATNTPLPTATNTPAGSSSMHVADLDAVTQSHQGGKWSATVTIQVVDNTGAPVANAIVAGTWSGAHSGSASCTTGAAGTCSVQSPQVPKGGSGNATMTWTVTNVTHSTLAYASASNTDPDGDSNGTSITANKPN
jgi:hypothetical protein